jgi:hypothetical protein
MYLHTDLLIICYICLTSGTVEDETPRLETHKPLAGQKVLVYSLSYYFILNVR